MSRPRILISEPNAPGETFLPYVWAILKSYWEHFGSDSEAFTWDDPIYLRETVTNGLDAVYSEPIDVLGLSCYTWNWDLNCEVARWAKAKNPNCLVIAGGPDPDFKEADFFVNHSYIDAIVVKDGEIPFTKILETVLSGGRDFKHIPGLYLPTPGPRLKLAGESLSAHFYTGSTEVPTIFDYSPYVEQSALYERIMAGRAGLWTMATLETNRGCPYSCSYCDWGSSTMSKVRRFEMSRVEAEVQWLGKQAVNFIFLADANFGIFARDVDITDRLTDAKSSFGYPQAIYYSPAKNNPERTVEIARRTHEAKLTSAHVLAVQHTDNDVLAATDRSNIPASKYREVVARLAELGIPCEVQLILGIPGDSLDKWKSSLAELMKWGVHDNFQVSPYALLPNAPAAEPAFKQKWEIETVERGLIPYGGIRNKSSQVDCTKSNIVVSFKGFSKDDWVEASTYSSFLRAYHNRALTRLPAIYLWFVHGVPYREYYDAIVDGFAKNSKTLAPIYNRVHELYAEFLRNPEASDEMDLSQFPDCQFLVDPSKWIYVNTCLNLDEFYVDLKRFLLDRFPNASGLGSAIDYQRDLVVLPDYSARVGKSLNMNRDWPAFFEATARIVTDERLPEPKRFFLPRVAAIAEEDRSGWEGSLNFGDGDITERTDRWLLQAVSTQNLAQYCILPHPRV